MKKTQDAVTAFLAKNAVTKCPPARARGANMNDISRRELTRTRMIIRLGK